MPGGRSQSKCLTSQVNSPAAFPTDSQVCSGPIHTCTGNSSSFSVRCLLCASLSGHPPEKGLLKRESKMCNVTTQAGRGHLVRLMLFNKEMEQGLKFSPKFKELQVKAKGLRTYLKAKFLFTSYFHLYFLLYISLFIF